MDLVDEEDVTFRQVGEDGGQVPGPNQGRPGRDAEAGGHLVGDDPSQGGLSESGRAGEQQMISGLGPPAGGLEHDVEVLLELRLAHELRQVTGPQGDLLGGLHRVGSRGNGPI